MLHGLSDVSALLMNLPEDRLHYFMVRVHFHISLLLLLTSMAAGQSYPDSPVYRDYRPRQDRDNRSTAYRQQVDIFLLERDAADGDALAQHELGVRYLTGRGVIPDTVKSSVWLRRAAEQGYAPAAYNYALLLANGWGVEWDPFQAYALFLRAARQGMPEAQFVVGVFHTDDLVVKQNWKEAHRWMSLAAESGNEGAKRGAEEIERRGHVPAAAATAKQRESADHATDTTARALSPFESASHSPTDTAAVPHADSGTDPTDTYSAVDVVSEKHNDDEWAPLLLDFNADTSRLNLSTTNLLHEVVASLSLSTGDSLRITSLLNPSTPDSLAVSLLLRLVRACNPEALLLLGRLHEEGLHVRKSTALAAKYYVRASWHESPLALSALGRLLGTSRNADLLLQDAWAGDADAQFAAAAIRALEIDNRLTAQQARDMLQRAVQAGSSDAVVQLGLWYAGGRIVKQDLPRALEAWRNAADMRNEEARLRLAAAAIFGEQHTLSPSTALPILEASARDGSLLAATALARSYELGIGRSPNKGIAARMYRDAAIRGSRSAYAALRRMHDDIRP